MLDKKPIPFLIAINPIITGITIGNKLVISVKTPANISPVTIFDKTDVAVVVAPDSIFTCSFLLRNLKEHIEKLI
nr:MAG TPA: hypothetical protein [Bacteriophage sp.]